jgi:hypothetical protein
MSARITPHREEPSDPVEASTYRARQAFAQATRAMLAGTLAPRAPRPKGVSRGGVAVRSESCVHCIDQGVDDETSYLLHSDPEFNVPVTSPEQAARADRAEVDRLVVEGYSYETAVQACTPVTRDIRVEGAIRRVR